MTSLNTIQQWIQDQYNDYISVYLYDDHARFTNGSGAHYLNIYPDGDSLKLRGERYGDSYEDTIPATKDALLTWMSTHY